MQVLFSYIFLILPNKWIIEEGLKRISTLPPLVCLSPCVYKTEEPYFCFAVCERYEKSLCKALYASVSVFLYGVDIYILSPAYFVIFSEFARG